MFTAEVALKDWWSPLSREEQEDYLHKHPRSRKKVDAQDRPERQVKPQRKQVGYRFP